MDYINGSNYLNKAKRYNDQQPSTDGQYYAPQSYYSYAPPPTMPSLAETESQYGRSYPYPAPYSPYGGSGFNLNIGYNQTPFGNGHDRYGYGGPRGGYGGNYVPPPPPYHPPYRPDDSYDSPRGGYQGGYGGGGYGGYGSPLSIDLMLRIMMPWFMNGGYPPRPPRGNPPPPSTMPEEPEPEIPDPIAGTGRIWGDPHFIGADGETYDIQGTPGKSYNLLSDKGIQVNAKFDTTDPSNPNGTTLMSEIGTSVMDSDGKLHQIMYTKDGTLYVDGVEVKEDGACLEGLVTRAGTNVTINSDEYKLMMSRTVNSKGISYLNLDFETENAISDDVMPHGLWGLTLDTDTDALTGDEGAGAQGGGVIYKIDANGNYVLTQPGDKDAYNLYQVPNVFSMLFPNFNYFGING